MITVFDVYSAVLLLVSLTVFVIRYIAQDPPIMPYLVIACVCAVGNTLGEMGGGWAAMSLLIAASFLFLTCFLAPYRKQWSERGAKSAAADNAAASPNAAPNAAS